MRGIGAKTGNRPRRARAGLLERFPGGSGRRYLAQAAALGCRTYVTGEGSHWNIPLAQELGVNLVFGGHYFTETFGVKALGLLLKDVYGLDYTFIDLPPSAYSH